MTCASITIATSASAAPPVGIDQTLSGTASPMGTTNNFVQALAYSNGVLYAGGLFTTATSTSGSAVTRRYLAAYNSSTGALISTFSFTFNAGVNALAVSPDGQTLYVGGAFTQVNSVTHNHIASINLATNTVNSWAPNLNNNVLSIAATATQVFAGGQFTQLNGASRSNLASINPTTGNLTTGWTGSATGGRVYSVALANSGSSLLVGGGFTTLDGVSQHALGSVSTATGAFQTFATTLPNTPDTPAGPGCTSIVKDIDVAGSTAYIAGEGSQFGCFDGVISVQTSGGATNWLNDCEGGTQAVLFLNNVVYHGSHMHDCAYGAGALNGGFTGEFDPAKRIYYHLSAINPADGSFEHWGPNTDTQMGPTVFATDGTQLFTGGQFTKVNGVKQAYLTRFGPISAINSAPSRPTAPTVVASAPGTVTVSWQGVADLDTGQLTYRLFRNGTLIDTESGESWEWVQPVFRFNDTGLTPGSNVSYTVTASDGHTTTAASTASATVTVGSTTPNYDTTVSGLNPTVNWRLNDSGSTAADSSATGTNTGSYQGSVTHGVADDRGGTGAVGLDGSSGNVISNTPQATTPNFTYAAWFKTSTLVGGDIVGFTADQSDTSQAVRGIWMENDGQLGFQLNAPPPPPPPAGQRPTLNDSHIRSAKSYNDGRWHLVVGTFNGSTMSLYADGTLVGTQATTEDTTPATGYFRAGYMDTAFFNYFFGFPNPGPVSPISDYLNGSLDDVSFYSSVLTPAQVANMWTGNAATAN